MIVKIDSEKCVGCKKCYNICPMDVFTWDEEARRPKVTYEGECWMCGCCWMDCPKRAIDMVYPVELY